MLQAADDDAGRAHILLSDIIVLVRQAVVNASFGRSGSQQAFVLTSGAGSSGDEISRGCVPWGPPRPGICNFGRASKTVNSDVQNALESLREIRRRSWLLLARPLRHVRGHCACGDERERR